MWIKLDLTELLSSECAFRRLSQKVFVLFIRLRFCVFGSASLHSSVCAHLRTGVGRDTSRTEDESAVSE